MIYIKQAEHKDMYYETNVLHGGRPPEKCNVAAGGCGLCATCMAVDLLSHKTFTLEDCRDLAVECVANHRPGTDLDVLGPAVAKKLELSYRPSASLDEVLACLRAGGKVVVHVQKGPFTTSGHYMLLVSCDGDELCFLDSGNWEKYERDELAEKVNSKSAPFRYCSAAFMHSQTSETHTKYHLFERIR